MAVGLSGLPALHAVPGILLGTAMAAIRKPGRRDLVVMRCTSGTQATAVFTRNRFSAAPVGVARTHLTQAAPRALLINTGYANAGTGVQGERDARACVEALAAQLGCRPEEVLPFSTGVIGERLPVERVIAGLPRCIEALSADGWAEAAHGIMTTDTVAKGATRRVTVAGHAVTVTGIAKGAGMIRPDMATMLAFLATDAALSAEALNRCLRDAVEQSFNRITVDGDTSTNDACVLLATGQTALAPMQRPAGEAYAAVAQAVKEVCIELAQAIVRDGEGARKFMTIEVEGGVTEADCLTVAYAIAHSPLVKTAFSASDPNWGRILAAIGRAPVAALDIGRVSIRLNDLEVVRHGALAAEYTETQGQAVMRAAEILVHVDLGSGAAQARVWTCDLSQDYVRINAEYRT